MSDKPAEELPDGQVWKWNEETQTWQPHAEGGVDLTGDGNG